MTEEITYKQLAPHSIQRAMRDTVEQIQVLQDADNGVVEKVSPSPALHSGFRDLDALLGGLNPGELIIVSGNNESVMSDFLCTIATAISMDSEAPIALCTPEISIVNCQVMLFSSVGQIDKTVLLTGEFSETDWPRLTSAMNRLQKSALYVYGEDTSQLSDLACLLRELKKYSGLSAVFVDSIAALKSDDNHMLNLQDQVIFAIQSLRSLAIELDVPIVISMDSTETIDSYRDKPPSLRDLNLPEETIKLADRIIFLHDNKLDIEDSSDGRLVDVTLMQNAFGTTGTASLRYIKKWGMFAELEP
ncbi:DnaB-like helicase C-terminal domain-containing protein [Pseudomonadota bacterium]